MTTELSESRSRREIVYGVSALHPAAPVRGHSQVAMIPESVSAALHRWIADNHIAHADFVFPSGRRTRTGERIPIRENVIRQRFDATPRRIGIEEDARQRRNLVLHSLRHSLVIAIQAEAVDGWQARAVVGHRDQRVFELYSDHTAPAHLPDVRDFQRRLLSAVSALIPLHVLVHDRGQRMM